MGAMTAAKAKALREPGEVPGRPDPVSPREAERPQVLVAAPHGPREAP